MTQLLWRVEGVGTTPDLDGWHQGLALHLLFQSVTLVIVRRDAQTRRYLSLTGCVNCRTDGCDRVCHRILFEQLIRTTLPGITLTPAIHLVPRATETRRVLATPRGIGTQPLDAAFLEQWAEGRLITTLSRLKAKPQPICIGVMLAVGRDGPEPGQALRARAWNVHPLATRIHRAAFERHMPGAVPVEGRAAEALFHVLRAPQFLIDGTPVSTQVLVPADDQGVSAQQAAQCEEIATRPVES